MHAVTLNINLIQLKSFSKQTELFTHFELVSVALTSYLNLLLKNSNNFLSDLRYCGKIGIYSRYVPVYFILYQIKVFVNKLLSNA